MKIRAFRTKSLRHAFKGEFDIILSMDQDGQVKASKYPEIGDTIGFDNGQVPEDGTIHLLSENLSVKIESGKVTEIIDPEKLNRKAFNY